MNDFNPRQQSAFGVEQLIRQMNDDWVKAMMRGDGDTRNLRST